MKIFLRCVAVYLIASALMQTLFNNEWPSLAAHPEFHWVMTIARVLGWLLLPVYFWLGIRLWRQADSHASHSREHASGIGELKEPKTL